MAQLIAGALPDTLGTPYREYMSRARRYIPFVI
jgi:protein-S-isoprenylcysteine O-methyltransferase Ste14